jgi:hypothetical protein
MHCLFPCSVHAIYLFYLPHSIISLSLFTYLPNLIARLIRYYYYLCLLDSSTLINRLMSEAKRAPVNSSLKCVRVFTTSDGGTSLEDIEIPCDGAHPLGWMSVAQKSTQVCPSGCMIITILSSSTFASFVLYCVGFVRLVFDTQMVIMIWIGMLHLVDSM